MNDVQAFVELLRTELEAHLPERYDVQAREPLEGELKASKTYQQVFITVDGIENAEPEYADGGLNTAVRVPVMVGTVMERPVVQDPSSGATLIPQTAKLYAGTTLRRLSIVQAIQKARRQFAHTHSHVLTDYIGEAPQMIEGYYVSVAGVTLTFNLDSEEHL